MDDERYEELAREEALVRLYETIHRLDQAITARGVSVALTESQRHLQQHGHRLFFGCCRVRDEVTADAHGGNAAAAPHASSSSSTSSGCDA